MYNMYDVQAVKALNTLIQYEEKGYLTPSDHIQKWMLVRLKERILKKYLTNFKNVV